MKKLSIVALLLFLVATFNVNAQTDNSSEAPLFDTPAIPDTITTLENRSSYLVAHFWENFDVSRPIPKENLGRLEQSFRMWTGLLQYAHRNVASSAIRDLMNRAHSNKTNYAIFAELADRSLYRIGAELQSDEAYMLFLNDIVHSKIMKPEALNYYKQQVVKINTCQPNNPIPDFEFTDVNGKKQKISEVDGEQVLVLFIDPDDPSSMVKRISLSADAGINANIANGNIKIVCICPVKYSKAWAADAKGYADNWTIGASEEVLNQLDLRMVPSFFILGKGNILLAKNAYFDAVKSFYSSYTPAEAPAPVETSVETEETPHS